MQKDLILQKLNDVKLELNEIEKLINLDEEEEIIELVDVVEEPAVVYVRKPIKKAIIVGINKYSSLQGADLNGCVNDANNMYNLLMTKFGFEVVNMTMLTDYNATKLSIMRELEWLVSDLVPGDELVFSFSGHGSQVADLNGDEIDKLDETICTTDTDWNDPFTDDILASYFKRVPEDVNLTFICDSCHSGTVSKDIQKIKKKKKGKTRFIKPPAEFQNASATKINKLGVKAFVNTPDQNHILLAGCAEDDYSSEGMFEGKPQGALTYVFCRAERIYTNLTWNRIAPHLENQIKMRGYTQIPQLVTKEANYSKKPFRS
jgi:hypothetical protein